MGLGVNLYAEGEVSDAELEAANALLLARSEIASWGESGDPAVVRGTGYENPRVEFETLARYYGPGYERGDWPAIYGAIRLMRAALPGCRVFYGADSDDNGTECTDEFLAEVWDHFLGPHGDDYRNSPGGGERYTVHAVSAEPVEGSQRCLCGHGPVSHGGSPGGHCTMCVVNGVLGCPTFRPEDTAR